MSPRIRFAPALTSLAVLAFAVPAHAEQVTLGSDLKAPATLIESQGADTAFWPVANAGTEFAIPSNGQILSIKIKGAAMREKGAGDPANMVHFQTLEPATADGSRVVYKTTEFFDMPIDAPETVKTFTPENLCVHQGGSVAFNTIGGFGWNGGDPFSPNPINDNHYRHGTPWQIFAAATSSSVAWFSQDNGTKNGMTMTPAGGTDAVGGYGRTVRGRELLMQVVLATGDDVSFECGGPRRDGNGTIMREMSVNPGQDMYVTREGAFSVLGYCGSRIGDCTGGTATVTINGKTVATGAFSAKEQETIKVPLKLSQADYIALANAPGATQDAILTLSNHLGSFSGAIKLHTTKGGTLTLKPQRPYVANDRRLRPYVICSLPSGCSGTAVITARGKTIAKVRFSTHKRGAILFNMRVSMRVFRALKKTGSLVAKLTVTSNAGNGSTQLVLRK